ncbi:uncharacterized protein A4U43_C08F21630 [Asparagus officinalis]|nr:uncharacterized protein A4U43_C08F21630 [Asparagus officinalis]
MGGGLGDVGVACWFRGAAVERSGKGSAGRELRRLRARAVAAMGTLSKLAVKAGVGGTAVRRRRGSFGEMASEAEVTDVWLGKQGFEVRMVVGVGDEGRGAGWVYVAGLLR